MIKIEKFKETVQVRSYHPELDMEDVVEVKNLPLVRFSSHERPFFMFENHCQNPDCDCNETILAFNEIDEMGAQIANSITFDISLDHVTWQEKRKIKRPKKVQSLVDEFVSDLSDEMKSEFKANYNNTKAESRNIAKFEMPVEDVYAGKVVSYAAVFGEDGSILSGGTGVSFLVEYDGQKLFVDDQYCIDPLCECDAVRLVFLKINEGTRIAYDLFTIRVPFKNEIEIDDKLTRYTKEDIKKIYDHWLKSDPEIMDIFETRYRKMKRVGQSLVERHPSKKTHKHTAGVEQKKIGRNDPCPCGSGKKYKKCCGKPK
jgi:hypothetical protein